MSDTTAAMLQDKLNSIERNVYDGIDFSQEVTTAYVLADELGERIDQLSAENAKLRDERDRMYKANVEKNGEILRLLKDNAKLRELVREMWAYAEQELLCDENCSYGAVCDWRDCVFKRRMRELGVDV
jgi:hypothetical protein